MFYFLVFKITVFSLMFFIISYIMNYRTLMQYFVFLYMKYFGVLYITFSAWAARQVN